jgi:hypothetical protein
MAGRGSTGSPPGRPCIPDAAVNLFAFSAGSAAGGLGVYDAAVSLTGQPLGGAQIGTLVPTNATIIGQGYSEVRVLLAAAGCIAQLNPSGNQLELVDEEQNIAPQQWTVVNRQGEVSIGRRGR